MTYTMITGATGVLGREFARQCYARGDNLLLTGRSAEKLETLKERLSVSGGGDIRVFAADLADEAQRENMYAAFGGLEISCLINVAGADIQKPFSEYTQQKLTFQTRVNFEAALSCTAFALSQRADRLRILNISSVCGECPMPNFAVYSAAKGALTSFSKAIAAEYRGSGVTVTVVLPGSVYTRDDVKEYISSLGAWAKFAAKQPDFVVRKSLKATERGKSCAVIGWANRLVLALSGMLPEGLRLRVIARKWAHTRKDAF